jgi:hypothetical protein
MLMRWPRAGCVGSTRGQPPRSRSVAANDEQGRLASCKYILRPPLANDRLTIIDEDHVRLDFKKPWSDTGPQQRRARSRKRPGNGLQSLIAAPGLLASTFPPPIDLPVGPAPSPHRRWPAHALEAGAVLAVVRVFVDLPSGQVIWEYARTIHIHGTRAKQCP